MKRVELRPGVLSHACVVCGRWCRDCRHTVHVPERCVGCDADPYRDNPPAEDGRVYCRGADCDADAFPAALPPGVARYPRLCRKCRETAADAREEAAEHRVLDRSVGVSAVLDRAPRPAPVDGPDGLPATRPRGRPPAHPARDSGAIPAQDRPPPPDPAAPIPRGFRPRAPEAERRAKRPSEYGGEGL